MAIEKIKILGAVLELSAKQHCQFSPCGPLSRFIGHNQIFLGSVFRDADNSRLELTFLNTYTVPWGGLWHLCDRYMQ